MKKWQCRMCGYVYDETLGDPDHDLAPGTAWADVPEEFICPECGAMKDDFDMVEI